MFIRIGENAPMLCHDTQKTNITLALLTAPSSGQENFSKRFLEIQPSDQTNPRRSSGIGRIKIGKLVGNEPGKQKPAIARLAKRSIDFRFTESTFPVALLTSDLCRATRLQELPDSSKHVNIS